MLKNLSLPNYFTMLTFYTLKFIYIYCNRGFPGGKAPTCQYRRCKRHRLDPWVGKIPWKRARHLTPVFLPGESSWREDPGGLQSIGFPRVRHLYLARTPTVFVHRNTVP